MKSIRILLPLVFVIAVSPAQAGLLDWLFGPDNYWECILDKMPGTLTYGGSMEVIAQCTKAFPDKTRYTLPRGLFKPKNLDDCWGKYNQDTHESLARQSIYQACYFLYPT